MYSSVYLVYYITTHRVRFSLEFHQLIYMCMLSLQSQLLHTHTAASSCHTSKLLAANAEIVESHVFYTLSQTY